jgi:hypothetical protein
MKTILAILKQAGGCGGYLECSSVPVTAHAMRRYQTAINQHYACGSHSHDKIANVLQPLLNPPASSQP